MTTTAAKQRLVRLGAVILCFVLTLSLVPITFSPAVADSGAAARDGGPVLPGNTHRAEVVFLDNSGAEIAQPYGPGNQDQRWVIDGDTILEPGYPGAVSGRVFQHWALMDGSSNWQKKPYDFSQRVALADTQNKITLKAIYRDQFNIEFILPKAQKVTGEQPEDRLVHTAVETECTDVDEAGDTGSEGYKKCTFGDYQSLVPDNIFTGEVVRGWTRDRQAALEDPDHAVLISDDEVINHNETVYAILDKGWEVGFNTEGGSHIVSQTVQDGKTMNTPADPVRHGWEFLGWKKDLSDKEYYDFSTPVTNHIVLHAVWKPSSTSFRVQLVVEDTVDKAGKPLPLAYNVFNVAGEVIENSEGQKMGADHHALDPAIAKEKAKAREGVYRLQKSQRIYQIDGQDVITGHKPDLSTICKFVLPKPPQGFVLLPPSGPDLAKPGAEGVQGDGSTVYTCKAKRERGPYGYNNLRQKMAFPKPDAQRVEKILQSEARLVPTTVVFYGMLSQGKFGDDGASFSGEDLTAASHIASKLLKVRDQPGTEVLRGKNESERLIVAEPSGYWPMLSTVTARKFQESSHRPDGGLHPNYLDNLKADPVELFSRPPRFSMDQPWVKFKSLSPPQRPFIAYYREVDANFLVGKNTDFYDSLHGTKRPAGFLNRMLDVVGKSPTIQPKNLNIVGPQAGDIAAPSVGYYKDTLYFTKVDHVPLDGFRQIYTGSGPTLGYRHLDPSVGVGAEFRAELDDSFFPPEIREQFDPNFKKKGPRTYIVMPYKRLAYNIYFDPDTGNAEDNYKITAPFDWTIGQARNTKFAGSDDETALEKLQGLSDYLAGFVPGKTKRASDGAVFKGWADGGSCASTIDVDSYRVPGYDSLITACWEFKRHTLRVFPNVAKPQEFNSSTYIDGELINEADWLDQQVAPKPGMDREKDLLGWQFRKRYVLRTLPNGKVIYRFTPWRYYDKNDPQPMYSDVDMRPVWTHQLLHVTYLPGQTDENGQPTGPQGSGKTERNLEYNPGLRARVLNSAFTPPAGYQFAGWVDEDGEPVKPDDAIYVNFNRVLKARWVPVARHSKLTYHSNYPKDVTAQERSRSVEHDDHGKLLASNAILDVESAPAEWQVGGWKFIGWSDTPDGPVKYTAAQDNADPATNQVLVNHRHKNHLYAQWEKGEVVVYVRKVDAQTGEELPGAQFALYDAQNITTGAELDNGPKIAEDRHCTAEAAEQAESSGPSGSCFVVKVMPGASYALYETEAPEGYELLGVPVRFSVSSDGQNTITVAEKELLPAVTIQGNVITIADTTHHELPATGGPGRHLPLVFALALMIAGSYLGLRRKNNG